MEISCPTFKDRPAIKLFGDLINDDRVVSADSIKIIWSQIFRLPPPVIQLGEAA